MKMLDQRQVETVAMSCGLPVRDLRRLWVAARRRDHSAQREVHQLLIRHPALQKVFMSFAAEHQRQKIVEAKLLGKPTKKKVKPKGAWQRASESAGRWISVFAGGLPSLGKRR